MSGDDARPVWAARLRAERERRGWNKHEMARRLLAAEGTAYPGVSSLVRQVRGWENAEHFPRDWTTAYARAFDTDEAELFGPDDKPPGQMSSSDMMDEIRRRLLSCLTVLGGGGVVLAQGLEPVRQVLIENLGFGPDGHLVDDWNEIVQEHGHAYPITPPSELLPSVAADLLEMQGVIQRTKSAEKRRPLYAPAGKLAALVAMTLTALGDRRQARDWGVTARHTADRSGDRNLRVWVRGHEAMSGLYAGRPFTLVLRRAEEALALAGEGSPCAAAFEAMAARAQVLALAGDHQQAEAAVEELERRFDGFDPAGVDDRLATDSWPETALRHTQAYVYTHTGNAGLAERAQSAAQALYPGSMPRQHAQIDLLRAVCLVGQGDIVGGIRHAERAVEPLGRQRTAGIQRGAAMVIAAVPHDARRKPSVVERSENLLRLAALHVSRPHV